MFALSRILVYSRFGLDRFLCSLYAGFWFIQGLAQTGFYVRCMQDSGLFKVWLRQVFMFAVYRILVYSRFGLDRFLCLLYAGLLFIQGLVQTGLYVSCMQDSCLFKVWFKQVFMFTVYRILVYSRFGLFYVCCIQDSGLFKVWFRQVLMFAVYRILVYSRFGVDRFLCSLYTGFWFIQGLVQTGFYVCCIQDSGLFKVWFRQASLQYVSVVYIYYHITFVIFPFKIVTFFHR